MDTELLKTFLEVSRTRHFGRAAEALYLTQSAVSFVFVSWRTSWGKSFTRHRNNIRLTSAGEKLLPYAETLMNTWQAARKEVANASAIMNFRSVPALLCGNACLMDGWESSIQSPITYSLRRGLRSGNRWSNSCTNVSLIS